MSEGTPWQETIYSVLWNTKTLKWIWKANKNMLCIFNISNILTLHIDSSKEIVQYSALPYRMKMT